MKKFFSIVLLVSLVFLVSSCAIFKKAPGDAKEKKKKRATVQQMTAASKALDASSADATTKLASLGTAPDFNLQDVYLNTYRLSDYKDKQAVLILFWTSWCPFCQKEMVVLNGRYGALLAQGLEVLAVNVGESMTKVQAHTKKNYFPYKVLVDLDTAVSRSYKIIGVPTYVLVDKQGNIVFQENYFPEREYKILVAK